MKKNTESLCTPIERAVLAQYFGLPDSNPGDLTGIDLSIPVDPEAWDDETNGCTG